MANVSLNLPAIARLSLTSKGVVSGEDEAAYAWWGGRNLLGIHFLDLLVLEVAADSEEVRAAQWEFISETALVEPLLLTVRRAEGDEIEIHVRFKREPDGFSAELHENQADDTRPAAEAAEVASEDENSLWGVLEESGPMGFFELNFPELKFRFSRVWKKMLGYAPHELADSHETLIKLVHPDDSDATPDRAERSGPNSRRPFSAEFRMQHRSGRYIWIQSSGVQEFGASGDLARVTGIHLNIQERKELEEETLLNEDRFISLVQAGQLALFDLDLEARKAYLSPAWRRILGYTKSEDDALPGLFRRIMKASAEDQQYLARVFEDEEEGRASFVKELRLPRKDGEYINIPTLLIRMTTRKGTLRRVIGLQYPADEGSSGKAWTGNVAPEALRAALDSINEAVVITNPHGKIIFLNTKASALSGLRDEEAAGRTLPDAVQLLQSIDQTPAGNLADEVLSNGQPIHFSRAFLLKRPGAPDPKEIVLSCHPLRNAEGKILGATVIFRDPNEMTLTPDELAKSNRFEALGLLAGGIAHDFNNLLTTIIGGISLAREIREWAPLENSERAGIAAKTLVSQLLTFTRRRDAGRQVVNLGAVVRDAAQLSTAGAAISAKIDLAPNLYPARIDPSRMSQVFQNLVINAVQAMADAGGTLSISGENVRLSESKVPGLREGDYVRISVQDTGGGISRENLARIFEPFFTTKKTGTGLGLSTVHAIVRDHDGQITVASEIGSGTTFSVYLPRSEDAVHKEIRRRPTLKFGRGKILFMDDDEDISEIGAAMLTRLDYQFDIARKGEEAIALYRRSLQIERPYDAVILDLTIIGGMGGEETLEKLLEMDRDACVIVSSGYSTSVTRDHYLTKGFSGVLAKPYRSEELGKVLRQVLGIDPPDLQE